MEKKGFIIIIGKYFNLENLLLYKKSMRNFFFFVLKFEK